MRLLLTSFLLLFITYTSAQQLFVNTYGTATGEERAFDMIILDDGSIIMVGDRYVTSTFEFHAYLLKVNADGDQQWSREIGGNDPINGAAICQLPNGNLLFAATDANVPNQSSGLLIGAYSSTAGSEVYVITHEFDQDATAIDLVPTSDNGVIVLCEYGNASSHTNMLCKLDANGDIVWTKILDPFPDNENPTGLVLLADGLVIGGSVIGESTSTENSFLIKTDLDGDQLWAYDDESAPTIIAGKLASDPINGGFFMAATTQIEGMPVYKILGLKNDNGSSNWLATFNTQHDKIDFGFGVAAMPDGGAVFTGSAYKSDTSNYRDLFLARIDSDGNILWQKFYGGDGADTGYDVQVDGNNLVAVGKSSVQGTEDVIIVRTDLNGNAAVGIPDLTAANWNVYPNPFSNTLTVSPLHQLGGPASIRIYDLQGRSVFETSINRRATLDLDALDAGIYLLLLQQEGKIFQQRVVKTN